MGDRACVIMGISGAIERERGPTAQYFEPNYDLEETEYPRKKLSRIVRVITDFAIFSYWSNPDPL